VDLETTSPRKTVNTFSLFNIFGTARSAFDARRTKMAAVPAASNGEQRGTTAASTVRREIRNDQSARVTNRERSLQLIRLAVLDTVAAIGPIRVIIGTIPFPNQ
jgi:hypothetical protein